MEANATQLPHCPVFPAGLGGRGSGEESDQRVMGAARAAADDRPGGAARGREWGAAASSQWPPSSSRGSPRPRTAPWSRTGVMVPFVRWSMARAVRLPKGKASSVLHALVPGVCSSLRPLVSWATGVGGAGGAGGWAGGLVGWRRACCCEGSRYGSVQQQTRQRAIAPAAARGWPAAKAPLTGLVVRLGKWQARARAALPWCPKEVR